MPTQRNFDPPPAKCSGCDQKRVPLFRRLDDGLKGTASWFCLNKGNCMWGSELETLKDSWAPATTWAKADEEVIEKGPVVEPENVEEIIEE